MHKISFHTSHATTQYVAFIFQVAIKFKQFVMELSREMFRTGTSLRHSDGRTFWTNLRVLQKCVYQCWDFWPCCTYPDNIPPIEDKLLKAISILLPTLPCQHFIGLREMEEKPELEWCKSNWVQLEIAIRQLALHIDFFFEQYYPPVALEAVNSDVVVQLLHAMYQ